MDDQLRALYIFAKTVELGSFRATAKVLRLSPSVVSYQIAQLEKQYGVALLYRSTRKLSLTHQGERVYASAQRMNMAAASNAFVCQPINSQTFSNTARCKVQRAVWGMCSSRVFSTMENGVSCSGDT